MFCNGRLSYSIGFRFTDQSIGSLMQLISNKSAVKPDLRKTLLVDGCFHDIAPMKIIELGIIAHKKIFLKYTEEQLARIRGQLETDEELLKMIREPEQHDRSSDEHLIFKIASTNQHQILEILIHLNADFTVKSKQHQISVIRQAYQENNYESVTLLHDYRRKLDLELQFFREALELNMHQSGKFKIPFNKVEVTAYLQMVASLFFDPAKMINIG